MPKLIKQEEKDSELNCSKTDKDLESESILIETPKINYNNTSICKEKHNQYTSTDWFKYDELETFDTFYDNYVEFKKYIDDILKSLNFGKEFDPQALSETNNDVKSIKHLEDEINELQIRTNN